MRMLLPVTCRTTTGAEVDLLIQDGRRVVPIEVKLGAALDHHTVRALRRCITDLGVAKGRVMTSSGGRSRLGRAIEIVPWSDVVHGRCAFGIGRR